LLTNPGEHLEAVQIGELQIKENRGRKRILGSILVVSRPPEIIERGLSIHHDMHGQAQIGFLHRPPHEKDVIFVVFHQEDCFLRRSHTLVCGEQFNPEPASGDAIGFQSRGAAHSLGGFSHNRQANARAVIFLARMNSLE